MDAGKTEVAVTFGLYPRGGQFVIAARTYFCTNGTADTRVCHLKISFASFQESYFGVKTGKGHKAIVVTVIFRSGGLYLFPLFQQISLYLLHLFGDVLIHLHLLVHVKIGKPVVHHNEGVDIVEFCTCFL